MIHWTPEGHIYKLGLNFFICSGWFRVVLCWASIEKKEVYTTYFRFRWSKQFKFFYSKNKSNIIEDYCFINDLYLFTREQKEEYDSRTN